MPKNRLSHLLGRRSSKTASAPPLPPPGFAAVEVAPLTELDVRCGDQRSIYEMAYLLARTGYVVEK